ncbi:MAG TPA: P-loop NTPase fold protein [Anaerolineae bacterium]|nr:P-loop NTPase fold protein [Anaerolineae bacterium]
MEEAKQSVIQESSSQLRLRWPTGDVRPILRPFGSDNDGLHIQAKRGEPVYACADGRVTYVGKPSADLPQSHLGRLDYVIRIKHDFFHTKYSTVYGFLQAGSARVRPGETVAAGQPIATVGADDPPPGLYLGLILEWTGRGDAVQNIDPTPYLDPPPAEIEEPNDDEEPEDDERVQKKVGKKRAPKPEADETETAEPTPIQIGATFALNDRPRGDDRLGFKDYARAFAAMLTNPATTPPLTIGVYGAWGMGKSFLMRLIREALENDKPADAPEFCFVEFNAWVYSGSDNLWAGLVSRIYERVEERLGASATRAFRLGRNRGKQARGISLRFIASVAVAVLLAVLANWSQIAKIWEDLPALLNASSIVALVLGVGSALINTYNFVSKAYTERAQQLRQMAAQPDFRTRIGFMADIKSEIDFVTGLLTKQSQGKPIRVVIFIDDLDRCSPTKAVEVLEAIMLLLSEDDSPFYVFLGLDARVLVKAIEERYGRVLVEAGISGYEYLDKIVQIPFTIPATDETGMKNYIRALLPRPGEDSTRALIRPASPAPDGQPSGGTPQPTNQLTNQPTSPPASTPQQPQPHHETPPPPPAVEVSFTTDEQQTFDDFAAYLSHNPRRAKRIVNIYRLSRMLADRGRAGLPAARSRQLIKWVILTEQWPYRMGLIIGQRENAAQLGAGIGSRDSDALAGLYDAVKDRLQSEQSRRLLHLDDDPEIFLNFITRESTPITAAEMRVFEPLTFNLNPALGGEIRLMLAKAHTMPAPTPGEEVNGVKREQEQGDPKRRGEEQD